MTERVCTKLLYVNKITNLAKADYLAETRSKWRGITDQLLLSPMAGDGEGPAGCHIDCPNQLIKSQVPLGGHRCPLQLSVAGMHRLFLLSDLQRHCSFH